MVHYGAMFTECSASDMYSRSPYSPATPAPFSAATTANSTYDTSQYHTATADSMPYYDQSYRPTYWQQTQTVKDETALAAYQQSGWTSYQTRDSMEMYKQQQEYFTLQNTAHGHSVTDQTSGLAMQYAPCAMMPGLTQQQAMEEGIAKDRQSQGYNGWISGTSSTNCKTRTKDKYRVVYSDHQRLELEKEFHFSRYITIKRKAELAVILSLSERQVKIWFQNRRAKERKMNKKKSGDDSKSATEAESRSSPCSSDGNDGDAPGTPSSSVML